MVDPVSIGLIVAGVVILLAGAVLSVYGIALLGALVGGGAGLLLAPELGFSATPELIVAAAVGVIAGIALTYLVLSIAIGILAFAVGSYVGAVGAEWLLDEPGLALIVVVGLVVGAVAAFLGNIFKRTVMIFITSFIGAALASTAVTAEDISNADILFALDDPIFLGLFALGVLTQLGLFKLSYVTRLVGALPGASVIRDRGDSES